MFSRTLLFNPPTYWYKLYSVFTLSFVKKCDRNKLLANFRACAANHYVIVEKCPYVMPNSAIVDFTDRRLHRIEKCRNAPGNAHGIAENRYLLFTRSGHLYSERFGNFLTSIVPIKLKVNKTKYILSLIQSLIVYSGGIF